MNLDELLQHPLVKQALRELTRDEYESVIATIQIMDPRLPDVIDRILRACSIAKEWSAA